MNNKNIGIIIIVFSLIMLIILTLVKANVDTQEAFLCEEVHKSPDFEIGQCPAHNSNNSWLLLSVFGMGFIILGFGVYLVALPNIETSKISKHKLNLSDLDADEKKIYNIIKEKEGSAYQTDIIKGTEFSKVKITRILDKLEQKKIVERKRRGMANLVVLK